MTATDHAHPDLVIVANRLPVRWVEDGENGGSWVTSPGGLVSAVAPFAAEAGRAAWVGWMGEEGEREPFELERLLVVPVPMSSQEKELHYDGMSNGTLWPLYHDKVIPAEFHRHWLDGYRTVNRRFAEATARVAGPGATVWVHDYQLQLVPSLLRELRPDLRIGFFLHIPFPPRELYWQLPWRQELTAGMLGADLVGFQTGEDAGNFRRVAVKLGVANREGRTGLRIGERCVLTQAFPIGIDVTRYAEAARSPEVGIAARTLRERLGDPKVLVLGIDRLDYTKGIDVRLRAFKELLAEGRIDPTEVMLVQVAQPSRDDVAAYVSLRENVERLVGEINGDHGREGLPVVHYVHQSRDFDEVLALYRAADVMLVTPLRDGMNLVAKEYVACRYDDTGALVLSEFAGASFELRDALLVNPYDIDGLKRTLARAIELEAGEAKRRMRVLRRAVARNDAHAWAGRFLATLRELPGTSASVPGVDERLDRAPAERDVAEAGR
jgi:trehalose 6-phosphate synthase